METCTRSALSSLKGLQPSSLRGTDMTPFTIHFISTDGKFVESLHHSDVQQISVSLPRRVACGEYVDIFNANPAAEYQYIYKPMRQRLTLAALKHYSWTIRHGFIVFNKNHVRLMHIIGWFWRNCNDDCQFQFCLLFCNKEALIC